MMNKEQHKKRKLDSIREAKLKKWKEHTSDLLRQKSKETNLKDVFAEHSPSRSTWDNVIDGENTYLDNLFYVMEKLGVTFIDLGCYEDEAALVDYLVREELVEAVWHPHTGQLITCVLAPKLLGPLLIKMKF